MPITLMNLLRTAGRVSGFLGPKKRGLFSRYLDPRKVKAGEKAASFSKGAPIKLKEGQIKGAATRYFTGPKIGARRTRQALTGFGGLLGADYVARKLAEPSDEEQIQESGVIPSRMQYPTRDELGSQVDIESRVEFERRKQAKFNKQMKQLMVNYGIVNLVNPTSAKEMLKLGTAILGQDIESMGNQRQAEIFDSIFGGGNVPATAMEAYERVMAAGGTAADAKEISGIVESATPAASTRAPSVVETKLQIGAQVKQLLAAGRDDEAKELYLQAIYAGIIDPPTGETGIKMSPEQAAEAFLRSAGAVGSDNIDSDMYNLVKID